MKIIQKNLNIDFSKSIKMISLLKTFQTLPIDKIISSLEKENINFENIPFPFTKGSTIDCDKTIRMKSATKPLMFTYYNINKVQRKILFKYEDIRKERIIMKIIKLMDIILKRDNIDLNFVTYGILPIGVDAGFINVVPNSKTLYNIELKEKFSIQNYIIENNPNLPINMIRENFIKSCAASCVISYLLGLGDRHLDNIMVTDTGLLFHIDFGYILGNDPKPLAPVMKITPETIDAMGGENSKGYKEFQSLCSKSYNCLRRHSNIFLTLLTMLSKLTPKIDNGKFNEEFKKIRLLKDLFQEL
jgi:phosphatidylinositol 3-kinase